MIVLLHVALQSLSKMSYMSIFFYKRQIDVVRDMWEQNVDLVGQTHTVDSMEIHQVSSDKFNW